jgi:hypothetical protein
MEKDLKLDALRHHAEQITKHLVDMGSLVSAGLAPSDLDPSIKITIARGGMSLVTARVVVEGPRAVATVEDHLTGYTYEVSVRAPAGDAPLETAARVLHEASLAGRL